MIENTEIIKKVIRFNNIVTGEIHGSVFFTYRKVFLKKYRGYSVRVKVLDLLKKEGVKTIMLQTEKRKDVLRAEIEDFDDLPTFIMKEKDGFQKCLPIEKWSKIGDQE